MIAEKHGCVLSGTCRGSNERTKTGTCVCNLSPGCAAQTCRLFIILIPIICWAIPIYLLICIRVRMPAVALPYAVDLCFEYFFSRTKELRWPPRVGPTPASGLANSTVRLCGDLLRCLKSQIADGGCYRHAICNKQIRRPRAPRAAGYRLSSVNGNYPFIFHIFVQICLYSFSPMQAWHR